MAFLEDDQLLTVAKRKCDDEGWPWTEPVILQHGPVRTLVTTNCDMRGGNVRVLINARSGEVVQAGFAPR